MCLGITSRLLTLYHARLRQVYPDSFKRVDLYYSVCQLLGSYHFRLPVRKYVLEIFEMRFTSELLQELDDLSATITQSTSCIPFTTTTSSDKSFQKPSTPAIVNPNDSIPQEKLEAKTKTMGFHVAS